MVFHIHIIPVPNKLYFGMFIYIWTIQKVNKGQSIRSQKLHHKAELSSPPDLY